MAGPSGPAFLYNFYPRSPCGERHKSNKLAEKKLVFLSTLSLRRATISIVLSIQPTKFLSTLSLRRATIIRFCRLHQKYPFLSTLSLRRATINTYHRIFGEGISIHALLAESDSRLFVWIAKRALISIHALLAESDCPMLKNSASVTLFLSTLSLRRAT